MAPLSRALGRGKGLFAVMNSETGFNFGNIDALTPRRQPRDREAIFGQTVRKGEPASGSEFGGFE